ncbi:MAG TPA: hypothetical protein VIK50_15930 [Gemmatimonadaceae bacterium]
MKLCLDPYDVAPRDVTAESLALAGWYDSQPAIRRLWGIREAERLRVIIAIEPTLDGDDVYPAWFANIDVRASELRRSTGSQVQLELIQESRCGGIEIEDDGVIIADLFWRDATVNLPNEVL